MAMGNMGMLGGGMGGERPQGGGSSQGPAARSIDALSRADGAAATAGMGHSLDGGAGSMGAGVGDTSNATGRMGAGSAGGSYGRPGGRGGGAPPRYRPY